MLHKLIGAHFLATYNEVWNMFKVKNKDNSSSWYLYSQLWTYFTPFSSVSVVNFEQVNAGWVYSFFDDWYSFLYFQDFSIPTFFQIKLLVYNHSKNILRFSYILAYFLFNKSHSSSTQVEQNLVIINKSWISLRS